MAIQRTNQNVVLFKYNDTPASTDVVTNSNVPFINPDIKKNEYQIYGGKLGNKKTYVDTDHTTATLDIEVMLRGNDKTGAAPDTPPAIAELLKASGLTETVNLDTSVSYTPSHSDISPSQMAVYIDGYKRVIAGAVADLKLSANIGECVKVIFSVSGYTTPSASSEANPSVTLDTESIGLFTKATAVTASGTNIEIDSFSFETNNEIKDNYATGKGQYDRVNFDPQINIGGIKIKGADEAVWDDLESGTLKNIIITIGSEVGKTITLTIPQARIIENSESDDSGQAKYSRIYRCEGDATGDNHFSLTWS